MLGVRATRAAVSANQMEIYTVQSMAAEGL
jgi:hypothetical protein